MPFDEQNYRQLRQSMQNSGVARDVLIGHTVFYKETSETTMIDSLEGVAAGASSPCSSSRFPSPGTPGKAPR